ncbi:TetR/AcrR family transcriptional regulator [Nocardia carnea]|uniref:TetR/AcrR family transcriptional regulator n=1 Tax=Nocardia carnea TaxID=37328 RepID=UPI00245745E6|nr:TetR/AcrR family transcriptional regulator [Nocardia carnea]
MSAASSRRNGRGGKLAKSVEPSQRGAATRDVILETAIDCFARSGYEGTSMSAVARSAGVAQPLMHYYFASKDELWRAAISKAFSEMLVQQKLNHELEELDPVSALQVLIRRHISFLARHPNVAPLLASEAQFSTDRVNWLTDTYIAPLEQHLSKLIELGRRDGRIRDDLPIPFVARFIVGSASAFFMTSALMERMYGIDTADPDAVETYTRVTIDLTLKGLLTTEQD